MQAHLNLRLREIQAIPQQKEKKAGGLVHLVEMIRRKVGKYVSIEEDAIFNDPNWPHLWS